MRRSRSEWLLAPLLLLPVVAGIVLLLWARFAYVTEVEPYRLDPAARARDAVDSLGAGAEALRERFLRDFGPFSIPPPDGVRNVPFRMGVLRGLLRTTADVTTDGEWIVADSFPGGLKPSALADARVRFEVETGWELLFWPEMWATSVFMGLLLWSLGEDRALARAAERPARRRPRFRGAG